HRVRGRKSPGQRKEGNKRDGSQPILAQNNFQSEQQEEKLQRTYDRHRDLPQPLVQRQTPSDQVFGGIESGRSSHAHHGDVTDLNDKNPNHAQHHAKQNVASHQRIAPLACQQPAPRNYGLRPAPPYPWFQREVEKPGRRGDEQPGTHRKHEQKERIEAGQKVPAGQPQQHLEHKYHSRQPESALPVTPPLAIIPACRINGAEQSSQYHGDPKEISNFL